MLVHSLHVTLQACAAEPRYHFPELTLSGGKFIHILGPNGAGKSTFLSLLAGMLAPQSVALCRTYLASNDGVLSDNRCQVKLSEESAPSVTQPQPQTNEVITPNDTVWHAHRGFYSAQYEPSFALKVADIMQFFVLEPSESAVADGLAPEIEKVFAIRQFWDRPITELSTGQQNRVHLARVCQQIYPALQRGEGMLLLDEAFTGLDIYYQQQLMQLLRRWVGLGNIIVHAHHELHSLPKYTDDEAIIITDGKLVHQGQIGVLDWSNIHQTIFHVDTI